MRNVSTSQIAWLVAELCLRASFELPEDVFQALQRAAQREKSPRGRWVLEAVVRNAELASRERLPICQDTGLVVCFIRLGRDVHLDGDLQEAVDAGVRKAFLEAPLRHSVLADPLDRSSNTGDNTPAILHLDLVEGDHIEVEVLPKGGGSENCSAAWMLTPGEGEDGIVERIVEQIRAVGGKWCPPGVVGVGVGGTLEHAALLAKCALARPVGWRHPQVRWASLEERLLEAVNATGVGPLGLGGKVTALDVHVEHYPCHLASLPVAVNLQCHAARRAAGAI